MKIIWRPEHFCIRHWCSGPWHWTTLMLMVTETLQFTHPVLNCHRGSHPCWLPQCLIPWHFHHSPTSTQLEVVWNHSSTYLYQGSWLCSDPFPFSPPGFLRAIYGCPCRTAHLPPLCFSLNAWWVCCCTDGFSECHLWQPGWWRWQCLLILIGGHKNLFHHQFIISILPSLLPSVLGQASQGFHLD